MAAQNPAPGHHRLPAFLRHFDRFLASFLGGLLPEERRYWILVPLTGVAAGLFAVGFVEMLDWVQILCWGASRGDVRDAVLSASPWRRLAVPAAGGLLVSLVYLIIGREKTLEGTSGLIESLAVRRGVLPAPRSIINGAVSILAVGSGASLGREGAMIQSGASVGALLGNWFRLKEHHVKILLACGAAGGMAAAYNVPIGASIFAMEILLGSFSLELFGPIIISTVISTAISRTLISNLQVYRIPQYTFRSSEIVVYLVLGVSLGLVSVVFIRFFSGLSVLFRWLDRFDAVKPIVAMAALGAVSMWLPDLLGNGYGTVNAVLGNDPGLSIQFLLVLPALKMLFAALCRAGDIPGGLFTPSLFVGAILGFGFGAGAHMLLPSWHLSQPGAYALIGMGAILAGTLQAPITSVLLVFEMTNDYQVILPLMTACIASTLVSHLLQKGSLFTEPLRRKGIQLPEAIAPAWLRQPRVQEFVTPEVETIGAAERFDKVVDTFLRTPLEHDRLYVVDGGGNYLGAISLHEIKLFIRESRDLDPVIAIDLMDSSFPSVDASEPISRAIEILAQSEAERLPVLDGPSSRRLLGSISKRQLLLAYRMSNLARIETGWTKDLAAKEEEASHPPGE